MLVKLLSCRISVLKFLWFVMRCCLLFSYNGFMRESMFSVGLQRIATSDVNRVKEIVDATFDKVIE